MSRYRGYSEEIEVLIDLLDEARKTNELMSEIKELLSEKEPVKNVQPEPKEMPKRGRPKRTA